MTRSDEQTFRVLPEQQNQTLAALLRKWLPGTPWSKIEQLLRARHVLVSGNLCVDSARRLKAAEVVKLLTHSAPAPPRESDVTIRFHDKQIVIVEKPSGITSVRHHEEQSWPKSRRQFQPTLEDMLPGIIGKRQGPRRTGAKSQFIPIFPVHRLDRDTSGLMAFARTQIAARHLQLQFRQHTTHRHYLAVVHGQIESQTITSRLIRDRGDGRRGSTDQQKLGKVAVTHVEVLERFPEHTFIKCRLETGRTHQIRIHLAEAGHPVCGEKVYGSREFTTAKKRPGPHAPRLALHAAELGLIHPTTNEPMEFEMPLPSDLKMFLQKLRRAPRR